VTISTVHDALNLIATLLAGISLAGLAFVLVILFRVESGSTAAQVNRREE